MDHKTRNRLNGSDMSPLRIGLKRAYEAPSDDDGIRVLVERLWPRGLSKADAAIDHWVKDLAPTPQLRTWFGHRPELWPEFRARYLAERSLATLTAANDNRDRTDSVAGGR